MMCNEEPLMEPELYILEEKKNLSSVKKTCNRKNQHLPLKTRIYLQRKLCPKKSAEIILRRDGFQFPNMQKCKIFLCR